MIRELELKDIKEANTLLSKFNYNISDKSFKDAFFKSFVYIDDDIKGIVVYSLIYDRVEIEYIIVDNDYRKKGIGSKLLKEIEKKKVKNITLEVRESNKEAISFYKSNGFKIEAIRKNYYETEDGYLMLKELGE